MRKQQTKSHATPPKGKEKQAAADKNSPGKRRDKGGAVLSSINGDHRKKTK